MSDSINYMRNEGNTLQMSIVINYYYYYYRVLYKHAQKINQRVLDTCAPNYLVPILRYFVFQFQILEFKTQNKIDKNELCSIII